MTTRIFKYPIEVTDDQEVILPVGARVLNVQVQQAGHGRNRAPQLVLYALVDDSALMHKRHVYILGTGHDATVLIERATQFVGTVNLMELLWFHVFVEVVQ